MTERQVRNLKDPYSILGVSRDATDDEVIAAAKRSITDAKIILNSFFNLISSLSFRFVGHANATVSHLPLTLRTKKTLPKCDAHSNLYYKHYTEFERKSQMQYMEKRDAPQNMRISLYFLVCFK